MLTLAAYYGESLMGLIRTVGDGYAIVFVHDIPVFPQHRRKGVGPALLKAVMDMYSHVRQIEVAADGSHRPDAFCRSMGFCKLLKMGCALHMFAISAHKACAACQNPPPDSSAGIAARRL